MLARENPIADFKKECEILFALLNSMDEASWHLTTLFKRWTITDILIHLHFWNKMAWLACTQESQFLALLPQIQSAAATGKFGDFEKSRVEPRGRALAEQWLNDALALCSVWQGLDLKSRVKWAGPDMSLRSSITARQMETWAHSLAIFDVLGLVRAESDRLLNIVHLGVNTFRWSFQVRQQTPPEQLPNLFLLSPEGHPWNWENPQSTSSIRGNAVEFCQVVTQTRHAADTQLLVEGPDALAWMHQAQCFAGPAESPPTVGSRFRQGSK